MLIKKISVPWVLRAGSAVAASFCVACSSAPSGPLDGKVVDGRTGAPVRDAVVLVFWQGNVGIVDGAKRCSHAETAVTDAAGHFRVAPLPFPHRGGAYVEWRFAYVFGEGYSTQLAAAPTDALEVSLLPASTDTSQRFDDLGRDFTAISNLYCGREDGSNKNMYRIQARQLSEMRKIASSPELATAVEQYASWLRDDLIDFTKPFKTITNPTTDARETVNSNPNDQFNSAELLK